MDSPEDRPESLPEQVTRLTNTAWGHISRTRRRWVLWGCLGGYIALAITLFCLRDAIATIFFGRVWLSLDTVLMSGYLFLGLWAALSRGRVWRRALVSLMLLFTLAGIQSAGDVLGVYGVANALFMWTLWFAFGLFLRRQRYAVFGHQDDPPPPLRVGVADLLVLTTAVSMALSAQILELRSLQEDPDIEVIEFGLGGELVAIVVMGVSGLLVYAPVLFAAFPAGNTSPRLVLLGSVVTFLLMQAVTIASFALTTAGSDFPISREFVWEVLASNTITPLGAISAILAVAAVTRWGGYRLMRPDAQQLREP